MDRTGSWEPDQLWLGRRESVGRDRGKRCVGAFVPILYSVSCLLGYFKTCQRLVPGVSTGRCHYAKQYGRHELKVDLGIRRGFRVLEFVGFTVFGLPQTTWHRLLYGAPCRQATSPPPLISLRIRPLHSTHLPSRGQPNSSLRGELDGL